MVKLNASIHPSLSEVVTEHLRRRNIVTIVDFVAADSIKVATLIGLSYADVTQIKRHILKNYGGTRKNATELFIRERDDVIPTGVMCLDALLKGGLQLEQLCELCGPSSSGKTQLCLTIAASVTATRTDIIVWYFDTKRDFSRLRFEEILATRKFKHEIIQQALQRTKVCHIYSSRELIRALWQLVTLFKTEHADTFLQEKKLLVIIDSLPAIIFKVTRQVAQGGYETIYELDDLAETCRFLAKECRAAVVTVNSITCWNTPTRMNPGTITPALGKYWARIPATRLLLTRQQDEARKIAIWKDLRLDSENSYCIVTVSNAGVIPT